MTVQEIFSFIGPDTQIIITNRFRVSIKEFEYTVSCNDKYFETYLGRPLLESEVIMIDGATKDNFPAIEIQALI